MGAIMLYHQSVMKNICLFILSLILPLCASPVAGYCQSPQTVLKIAIIPHRSNLGNEQAYSAFFSELVKETGIRFTWLGSKTYDDVINKLHTGEVDIGYVGPFSYVTAQDSFGVKILCRTISEGKEEFYHSIIVTRKDSGIQRLQDLKGKSFSFTDPDSTSGYLFPLARLIASGISQEDFSEVRFLKRHVNSLLAVYKGHVDAGATSITSFNKIDVNMAEMRILWQSEPIYRGLWVARKDLPEEQFTKIQQAMLQISASPKSDEIFKELSTKGFKVGKDSDYDNVRDVIKRLRGIKSMTNL
ncbi:phosphate/phosphite/phosphonate ABC transporter substrate-binding protein [Desulfopila sp. IMCC35006]|nr:phosphate/phosphite/phosphonate ABC transporter substrate-binding protein [Desulfopila sp. IMCC35006]